MTYRFHAPLAILSIISLTACSAPFEIYRGETPTAEAPPVSEGAGPVRPKARPDVWATDPAMAQGAPAMAGAQTTGDLGLTVASLGSPTEPGHWIKTPLVTEETAGRAVSVKTGKSVALRLIPIAGEAGSGSRISLLSMQSLGHALTDLAELRLSAK